MADSKVRIGEIAKSMNPVYDLKNYDSSNKLYECKHDGYLWIRFDEYNKSIAVWLYPYDEQTYTYFNDIRLTGQSDTKLMFLKKGTKLYTNMSTVCQGDMRFIELLEG